MPQYSYVHILFWNTFHHNCLYQYTLRSCRVKIAHCSTTPVYSELRKDFTTSLLQDYQFVKECIIPNCAYTKWEEYTQNTWSAEGLAGGKTTEATEEDEEDLDLEGDLDLLVFLAFFFLSLLPFLDLRLEDCLRVGAATGTEPIVPPKGVGGGIENKGTIGLAAN